MATPVVIHGEATLGAPPAGGGGAFSGASIHKAGPQTISSTGPGIFDNINLVALDTVFYDTDGYADVANNRLLVPTDGHYRIGYLANIGPTTVTGYLRIYPNIQFAGSGINPAGGPYGLYLPGTGVFNVVFGDYGQNGWVEGNLHTGDTVYLNIYHGASGDVELGSTEDGNYLSIERLGDPLTLFP